jgi:muconolactone delta-isomerase
MTTAPFSRFGAVEFLVTMTTQVPEGTTDTAVRDVRNREAAHSKDLAAQGHLLRLWRPPLAPGEWRTLGLFGADDRTALEAILVSMPLRVWRTDEAVPLSPHPNDPGRRMPERVARATGTEFFTTITIMVPVDVPSHVVDEVDAREADLAREQAEEGRLLRLWGLPGEHRTLGLWRAGSAEEMDAIVTSLPLRPWAQVETVELSPHPSDPEGTPP